MASNQQITDAITNAVVGGIRKASGDAGSVETHSISDLVSADKYLCSKSAGAEAANTGSNKLPFQISRIRFGGTT